MKYTFQNLPQNVARYTLLHSCGLAAGRRVVLQIISTDWRCQGTQSHRGTYQTKLFRIQIWSPYTHVRRITPTMHKEQHANKHAAATSLTPKPTNRQDSTLRHPISALTSNTTHHIHESHTIQFPVWTLEKEESFLKIYSEGLPPGEHSELHPPAPFPSH
jgi:hypothetical protein